MHDLQPSQSRMSVHCNRLDDPSRSVVPVPSAGEAEEDGYDDEYALEDVEIAASDYIKPTLLGNFRAAWEGLPQEAEVGRLNAPRCCTGLSCPDLPTSIRSCFGDGWQAGPV